MSRGSIVGLKEVTQIPGRLLGKISGRCFKLAVYSPQKTRLDQRLFSLADDCC